MWCWCVGVCGVLIGGLHTLWFGVLVMLCGGANVCVFLRGADAPLWVGGVGVSVVCWLRVAWGVAPLWFGVFVAWCVGVDVCVFLKGCCTLAVLMVLVCWWCAAWGRYTMWFGGVGASPLVDHNYS